MEGIKGGKNLARLAVRRSTCRSLFMVRWLNHRYSCFLFLLSIQDSSRALNGDKQPSLPRTWLLVVGRDHFRFYDFWRDYESNLARRDVSRETLGGDDSVPSEPPREKKKKKIPPCCGCSSTIPPVKPPNPQPTRAGSQLTHCWLGMATEVRRSAMAPSSWSVRPWFFCRAFILPQETKKLR